MSGINVRNILDEQVALITVTVLPDGNGRSQRSVVVTVGIPEKKVVMRAGTYEQIPQLIDAAWGDYAKFEITATPVNSGDDDLLDETAVTDEEETQSTFTYDDDAF